MNVDEALTVYNTVSELANKLGVSVQAVYRWKSAGKIPERQQLKIQIMTDGALKADEFPSFRPGDTYPVTAHLTGELIKKAELIGDGNRTLGIRMAISGYQLPTENAQTGSEF